jgi:hypothetical protein
MTLDEMLDHFKSGLLTKDCVRSWLEIKLEQAKLTGKIEMLDQIQADLKAKPL